MSDLSSINAFKSACATEPKRKRKASSSVSIRFTHDERKQLNRDAGKLSLSAYIRQKLLGDTVKKRKPQYMRKSRQPKPDYVELARILGQLGQSELATSMLVLALAAQSGALPVTPELEEKLDKACDDIHGMSIALISSLRIKPQ